MKRMGWAIDWSREVSTAEPEYYRWTQWLFLRFFERGLAYRKEAPVKWCPKDQTVLANEQVIDGRCERCGTEVEARNLDAVVLQDHRLRRRAARRDGAARVVARARADDAAKLDRPLRGRAGRLQRRGARRGAARLHDAARTRSSARRSSCSRPSTRSSTELDGGREHEAEVAAYVRHAAARSAVERETKEKDGVFTGRYAINPVNGEPIPIWVADYVLMEYGTGAIMAVPAHDERDHAFAERYGLDVRQVVAPAGGEPSPEASAFVAHSEDEVLVNSGEFTGLPAPGGRSGRSSTWLAERGARRGDDRLPAARLAALAAALLGLSDPDRPLRRLRRGAGARRPAARRCCPRSRTTCRRAARRSPPPRNGSRRRARAAAAPRGARRTRWTRSSTRPGTSCATPTRGTTTPPCDPRDRRLLAAGQAVHRRDRARVLHLLYARFFTKVLNDMGLLGFREPFSRLFTQGMIYRHGAKMSKSKGNVVSPDECDRTLRRRRAPALHPLHGARRAGQGVVRTRASRATCAASSTASGGSRASVAARAPVEAAADTPLARKAHRTIAEGHRRHRPRASSSTRRSRR